MYYTDRMSSICDKISGDIVPDVNATAIIINIFGLTLFVNNLHRIFIDILYDVLYLIRGKVLFPLGDPNRHNLRDPLRMFVVFV